MSADPPRLVDDPAAPAALRADLRHAIENPPAIPLPEAPPLSTASATGAAVGALATVGVLIAGGLLGYWLWPTDAAPVDEPPAPIESVAPTTAPAPAAPAPEPPSPEAEAEAAAPEPTSVAAPEAAASEASRQPQPETPTAARSLSDEIAHMAELRRLATRDPRRALAMARAGERRFASGLFGEERQALIVLSLDRLGRSEATAAARRFLRHHPASPFAPRIRPIAEGGAPPFQGAPP